MDETQDMLLDYEDFDAADAFIDWWESLTEAQLFILRNMYTKTGDLSDVAGIAFQAGWEAAKGQS